MAALSSLIQDSFDSETRKAGELDFRIGRSSDLSIEEGVITGRVRDAYDSSRHQVNIDLSHPERVLASCDCEDFEKHSSCRHIWALIRAADVEVKKDPSQLVWIMQSAMRAGGVPHAARPVAKRLPAWSKKLDEFARRAAYGMKGPHALLSAVFPADTEIVYRFDYETATNWEDFPTITVCTRKISGGKYAELKPLRNAERWAAAPDTEDQGIRNLLLLGGDRYESRRMQSGDDLVISAEAMPTLIKRICATGRAIAQPVQYDAPSGDPVPLVWDADAPYDLCVEGTLDDNTVTFDAIFRREQQQVKLSVIAFVLDEYVLTERGRLIRYRSPSINLLDSLIDTFPLHVPVAEANAVLRKLAAIKGMPAIAIPDELNVRSVDKPPVPRLQIKREQQRDQLTGSVIFDYGNHAIEAESTQHTLLIPGEDGDVLLHRQLAAETEAMRKLRALELKPASASEPTRFRVPIQRLPDVVRQLTREGWKVEAEGQLYRSARSFKISVSSGIDWLDVQGKADFGGQEVSLPAILAALRRGEKTILLGDGTVGVLPEEWLKRYGMFGTVGDVQDDEVVRFKAKQMVILDAMLAELPDVDVDAQFTQAREHLKSFQQVRPAEAPPGFVGTLRGYQREGLGWMKFLNEFNFGGCLADDMGLGKTIQVLALLEERRAAGAGPSLVVAPRSLIFNWQNEAAKFAPQLRVLDHSTAARRKTTDHLNDYDLVLTTYGALRVDAAILKDFEFDYVILDEAQAIKNAQTVSSKAARLLRGRHRLAMTGTPIENHLGELWSLFDFINPGMFGENSGFKILVDDETAAARTAIARAIRPFMLRRTKKQVATDLPERIEQTLVCEMEPKQRKIYDELRKYYRAEISKSVEEVGINQSQMVILEALLRLRQAACHPGLIDRKHAKVPSAKLDTLIDQVREATEEGHKVLIFSQFTSLLAMVKVALDKEKLTYEYLDGQTRDRQARVDRFQTDPTCPVFLISLKAGGVGLNLTAADYVFLLDPWWNPAVEAQAIDRTHRIGQNRTVMAYRLIAKDTVEEKVLDLQRTKRKLADAIIGENERASSAITKDDLALLLA